jgi:hypothetical protein
MGIFGADILSHGRGCSPPGKERAISALLFQRPAGPHTHLLLHDLYQAIDFVDGCNELPFPTMGFAPPTLKRRGFKSLGSVHSSEAEQLVINYTIVYLCITYSALYYEHRMASINLHLEAWLSMVAIIVVRGELMSLRGDGFCKPLCWPGAWCCGVVEICHTGSSNIRWATQTLTRPPTTCATI